MNQKLNLTYGVSQRRFILHSTSPAMPCSILRIAAISLPAIQVLLMLLYNGVFTDFEVSIYSIVFISIDIVHHLFFRFVASLDSHL